MSRIREIRQIGSILKRKSRDRKRNNDIDPVKKHKKRKKSKEHIHKNWDHDLWD